MAITVPLKTRTRLHLQLAGHGEFSLEVADWLERRFPHMSPDVQADPGLHLSIDAPAVGLDDLDGWARQFALALEPLSTILAVLELCFYELDIPAGRVVSMHVTDL